MHTRTACEARHAAPSLAVFVSGRQALHDMAELRRGFDQCRMKLSAATADVSGPACWGALPLCPAFNMWVYVCRMQQAAATKKELESAQSISERLKADVQKVQSELEGTTAKLIAAESERSQVAAEHDSLADEHRGALARVEALEVCTCACRCHFACCNGLTVPVVVAVVAFAVVAASSAVWKICRRAHLSRP